MEKGHLMVCKVQLNGKQQEPAFIAFITTKFLTPNKLFEFIRSNLHGINAKFVTVDDWHVQEDFLHARLSGAKKIAGTQKLHSFVPINRSTLEVRHYSCSNESRSVIIRWQNNVKELDLGAIRGYVAVEYDGVWWLAYVHQVDIERKEILVNFLRPNGPSASFVYPRQQDLHLVDASDILTILNPKTVTGRTYTLSTEDEAIASAVLHCHLRL